MKLLASFNCYKLQILVLQSETSLLMREKLWRVINYLPFNFLDSILAKRGKEIFLLDHNL